MPGFLPLGASKGSGMLSQLTQGFTRGPWTRVERAQQHSSYDPLKGLLPPTRLAAARLQLGPIQGM